MSIKPAALPKSSTMRLDAPSISLSDDSTPAIRTRRLVSASPGWSTSTPAICRSWSLALVMNTCE